MKSEKALATRIIGGISILFLSQSVLGQVNPPAPVPAPAPVGPPTAEADSNTIGSRQTSHPASLNPIPPVHVKKSENFVYSRVLLANQSLALKLVDANDQPIPNVTWKSIDNKIATVTEDGIVVAVGNGTVQISATINASPQADASVIVVVSSVGGFRPVDIQLNIMDDKTAGDLFGDVTAKEFYVTRIRVFNALNNSDDVGLQGKSILAFSESTTAKVIIEKEYDSDRKTGDILVPQNDPVKGRTIMAKPAGGWSVVTDADLHREFPSDSGYPDTATPHAFTYRPYVYELMLNSVDARYQQEPRYKVRRSLQAIGLAGSFLTGLRFWRGSALPFFNAFNGVLLGNYDTILPTLNESQRQNLVTQAMQPLEQVAFGSDIAKVLFFPKSEFSGVLRGYRTRISTIDTNSFSMVVSVLNNSTTVNSGSGGNGAP